MLSRSEEQLPSLAERYRAGLLGVAVGDALGATLEFLSQAEVSSRYGTLTEIIGKGWLDLKPGDITDDTQMTLAVAEGILQDPNSPVAAIGSRFIAWLASAPKDVGTTCRIAISAAQTYGSWDQARTTVAEQLGEKAAGNGSLMRTLPVVLAYYGDDSRVSEMAARISEMTHPTPVATQCCQLYCLLGCRLLDGLSKEAAFAWLEQQARELTVPGIVWDAITVEPNAAAIRSTGYVIDSLRAALWAFKGTQSAEECIVKAANLGGDADTIAAIAGGLAGLHYGNVPDRWVRRLLERERIEHIAELLAGLHVTSSKECFWPGYCCSRCIISFR